MNVMERRYCPSCGTLLTKCPECGEYFSPVNSSHILCKPRCRTRRSRRLNKLANNEKCNG